MGKREIVISIKEQLISPSQESWTSETAFSDVFSTGTDMILRHMF